MRFFARLSLLVGLLSLLPIASYADLNPFGPSGLQLTKEDYKEMAAAAQPLLIDDSLPIGTTQSWNNPKSGNQGSIKLLDRFETKYQGNTLPCRKLAYHVQTKGVADAYNITLDRCKVADGSWKLL
jgi:surface antigen